MDRFKYVEILEENLKASAKKLKLGRHWTFQQDSDPKVHYYSKMPILHVILQLTFFLQHTSNHAKEWFKDNGIKVLDWPSMNPDLNPIEHLWAELKTAVQLRQPTSVEDAWTICQEEWPKLVPKCRTLVESMPRRCQAVIDANGHATKY